MAALAVLIAAGELLPTLQSRLTTPYEHLWFADVDALRALEAITTKRPALIVLERQFASTPRGAALINRVKADGSLAEIEIRVIPYDAVNLDAAESLPEPAPAATEPVEPVIAADPGPAPALDYRGTRRAPRFRTPQGPEVLVDGKSGVLVDISIIGAQLITPSVMKPNQRVRIAIPDGDLTLRCVASVVWASFEIPKGRSPQYRVGLEFHDADQAAVEAFARRHGQE